jgi:hypothetical protein
MMAERALAVVNTDRDWEREYNELKAYSDKRDDDFSILLQSIVSLLSSNASLQRRGFKQALRVSVEKAVAEEHERGAAAFQARQEIEAAHNFVVLVINEISWLASWKHYAAIPNRNRVDYLREVLEGAYPRLSEALAALDQARLTHNPTIDAVYSGWDNPGAIEIAMNILSALRQLFDLQNGDNGDALEKIIRDYDPENYDRVRRNIQGVKASRAGRKPLKETEAIQDIVVPLIPEYRPGRQVKWNLLAKRLLKDLTDKEPGQNLSPNEQVVLDDIRRCPGGVDAWADSLRQMGLK